MVVYKDPRKTKKTSIPDVDGSEVEMWNTLLWGDLEKVFTVQGSDLEKSVKALVLLIKDWNLTDEKNVKLPISEETLRTFKADVIVHLLKQTDFSPDLLKKK